MKKTLLLLGAVAILSFVSSCKDDNPISCAQKLTEVEAAAIAFSTNQTTENCNAYKEALQDYINCDGVVDKTAYQTTLDNLDCTSL